MEAETVSPGSRAGVGVAERPGESISTQGDFGAQGASGEGTFGTSGGDPNSLTSGRYDRESTRLHESRGDQTDRSVQPIDSGVTLTCFCGSEMRAVGSGQNRARSARVGE
jgi:hypothetical protein